MRDEGAFNAFLSKEFKKQLPEVYAIKIADKYQCGISDFILWLQGTSVVLESKLIKTIKASSMDTKILSHPFSPTQLNFFRRISDARCLAFGLVGVDDKKEMFLIPPHFISEEGNLTARDLSFGNQFPLNSAGAAQLVSHLVWGVNARR